jgi:hypothetical protein
VRLFSGAYLTLFIRRFSARARLRVSRSADHFEADRQPPSGVHFAPNKEQNKRTDNRHDETVGVIYTADNITIKTIC